MGQRHKVFKGELMTCVICSAQAPSNPKLDSDWRAIEMDEELFYFCPDEFPSDRAGREEFKKAYQVAMACGMNEITKAKGGEATPEVEQYRAIRSQERQTKENLKSKGFGYSL